MGSGEQWWAVVSSGGQCVCPQCVGRTSTKQHLHSSYLVRVAEFEASLGCVADDDTAEEELPVVLPVHAHTIKAGLLWAQDAEVLADSMLLKDGGHI